MPARSIPKTLIVSIIMHADAFAEYDFSDAPFNFLNELDPTLRAPNAP